MSSEGSDYVPSKEFKDSGAIYSSEGFSEFNEVSDAIEGPKELMCLFFSHRKSRADSLGIIECFENADGLQELCGGSPLTRDSSSCKKNNTFKDEYSKLSIIQGEIQLRGPKMCPCSPDKESGAHGEVWRTSDLTIDDPKPYGEMKREVCISSTLKYMGLGITGKAAPKIHVYVFVINNMSSSSDVCHGIEVILHKKKIMFARILQVDNAPEFVAKISIILMEMFRGTSPLWCQSMQAIYSRNVFRPSVTIGYTSYDTICNPQEALLVCSRATRVALGKTLVVIMFAILVGRDGSELLFTFDCFGVQFLGHRYYLRLYSRCDCSTLLCVSLVTALLHLSGSIYLKIGSQACISPEGKFTKIPSDVIGGSTLGSHLVAEVLVPDDPLLEIRFVNNIDAAGIDHQIAQLGFELASTLVVVILRSGSTLVTENGLLKVQKASWEAGLKFTNHSAASLQRIHFRKMLVVFALINYTSGTMKLVMCWYWASNGVRLKDTIVLPYTDNLLVCSVYLQHVFMELPENKLNMDGKMVCQGPLVHGNKGSTDQHAFIQQLRGVHNLFATFMEVLHGFLKLQLSLLDDFWKWALAWIFAYISMHRYEFLLFSLPRPPEVDDLEDKVDFKGRGMMRINNVGFGLAEVFVMTKVHTRIVKRLLV